MSPGMFMRLFRIDPSATFVATRIGTVVVAGAARVSGVPTKVRLVDPLPPAGFEIVIELPPLAVTMVLFGICIPVTAMPTTNAAGGVIETVFDWLVVLADTEFMVTGVPIVAVVASALPELAPVMTILVPAVDGMKTGASKL
jgi:hypothetical protein